LIRLAALVGILTISFSAIFVRLADVAPATAGLFRALYALPVLFILNRVLGDNRSRRLRVMAVASGLLLAGDIALWHTAIGLVGAGLSTVVANTQVVWVGVAGWLIFRERPTRTAFVVIPMVLVGVGLIGGIGAERAYGDNPALGAGLALIASLFYAGFLLLFRATTADRGQTAGPLLDVTIGIAAAFLIGGWLDPGFSVVPVFPAHWWLLALALLVHTGGWLLIAVAIPRLPALDTSVMLLLQPAATIVWAGLIFDERLSTSQWIGVGVVLVGIIIGATRGIVTPAVANRPLDP
jgi:drug/metabolite transporter (DMT)-like permease